MDLAPFVQLLTQLASEDNSSRVQAERGYEEAKEKVPEQLVIALSLIVQDNNQTIQCRSLAAVLLRKQILLIAVLDATTLHTLKANILHALEQINDRGILRHLCFLTSGLAGHILSDGKNWDELLGFLIKWTESPTELYRESALEILSQLLTHLDSRFNSFFDTLQGILIKGLQDPSPKVRLAALNGTVHFVVYRSKSRVNFQPYLPHMFETVSMALTNGDEDIARLALESIVELVEFLPQFFLEHVDQLLDGMYKLATDHSWEDSTRFSALEFFLSLCETRPDSIMEHPKHISTFVSLMLNMLTNVEDNPDWNEGSSADIEDEESDLGGEGLDRTALSLKGGVLVPILFSMIPNYLGGEANWKQRRAALMAISIVGEGCSEVLDPNLDNVMKMIFPMFRDVHERVRWASCNTVGQLATDFAPDFQRRYSEGVLQSLIMVMDDKENPRVQAHAAAAIINFCDQCDSDILAPYLPTLLQKLDQLLKQGKMIVLEQSLTAVAAIADCVKELFIPYYDIFMPFFKGVLLNATGEMYSKLRGKSMEAISLLAVAVGLETFSKDAQEVLDTLLRIQSGPLDELQVPFLQQAWARLCKALGKDFVPYLPALVPTLLRSAELPPDIKIVIEADDNELDKSKWKQITVGEDKVVALNMARVQEKISALTMLYWLADELKSFFFPYVDRLIPICQLSLKFYYSEEVRISSASLLPCIVRCTIEYVKENPQNEMANNQITVLFQQIFADLLHALVEEPSSEVTITLINSFRAIIAHMGCRYVGASQFSHIKSTFETLLGRFLEHKEEIQQNAREAGEMYNYANAASYNDIFIKIGEVIANCMDIYGAAILSYLTDIFSVFKSFVAENVQIRERYISLIVFNSMVQSGGTDAISIYQNWIPEVIQMTKSPYPAIRKVSANSIILLAIHAASLFPQILQTCLNRLNAVIVDKESRGKYYVEATQTAIAAVGKIIDLYAAHIDLNQVLSIWLKYLPVTSPVESNTIYQLLCLFFVRHTEIVLGDNLVNLSFILQMFADVLGSQLINDSTFNAIISLLSRMRIEFPADVMQQAWVKLSPEQQQKLSQVLSP